MNFIWRETNGEDKKNFNDWHKKAKLKNNDYDNISVFLTDKTLLGNFIDNITTSFPERLKALTATLNSVSVGVVVAYIRNEPNLDNVITFEAIAVNPEFQKMGIGTAMVFDIVKNSDAILKDIPEYFFACIDKDNASSEAIFTKNGFKTDKIEHFDYYSYYLDKSDADLLKDKPEPSLDLAIKETLKLAQLQKNNIKTRK